MNYCSQITPRFNIEKASRVQSKLASKLILEDRLEKVEKVAGLDVSYARIGGNELGIGVASLIEIDTLRLVLTLHVIKPVCVPYIPGLLAFREMEVLAPLVNEILNEADIIIVDGHGIAHPRGFGIASHIGLVFNKPSIGVAKHRLIGVEKEIEGRRVLIHAGKIVAEILENKGLKLYISPGNRISLETARLLVEKLITKPGELPEPTRIADILSKKIKIELEKKGVEEHIIGRVFRHTPLTS